MQHLQKITTLAKKIRKQHPNKKWTDCVKAASKELKAGKKVAGYTGTRRDGNKTTVSYTTKKAAAKPKQGKLFGEKHTDTKSHNVSIKVAGIGVADFKKKHDLIQKHVGELMGKIAYHKHMSTTDKHSKAKHNAAIKELQAKVKQHKTTIAKLKKVI